MKEEWASICHCSAFNMGTASWVYVYTLETPLCHVLGFVDLHTSYHASYQHHTLPYISCKASKHIWKLHVEGWLRTSGDSILSWIRMFDEQFLQKNNDWKTRFVERA